MAARLVATWTAIFTTIVGAMSLAEIPLSTDIKAPVTKGLEPGMRTFTANIPLEQPGLSGVMGRGRGSHQGHPSQVHLTPGGPNKMVVMWNTDSYTVARGPLQPLDPASVPGYVFWGQSGDNLDKTTEAVGEVYSQVYGAGPGYNQGDIATNYTSGILHHAILEDLVPGQVYFYRVGYAHHLSPVNSFRGLAAPGHTYPQRIIALADLGTSYNSSDTLSHILGHVDELANQPAIFYIGDYSYADTWLLNGTDTTDIRANKKGRGSEGVISASYQPVWDHWQKLIEPLVSKVPLVGCMGNHEIEQQTAGTQAIFVSAQAHWKFDYMGAASGGNFFYFSFDVGPVHAIFISPYQDYTAGSPQWQWLYGDLRAVDRSVTPFVVVSFHHPWYTSDSPYKEHEHMRVEMEPLTYKFGVDIFFYGHVHGYERTSPVYDYNVDPCGAVHITVGDAGNSEGCSFFKHRAAYNKNPDGSLAALSFADTRCPNISATSRPVYMVAVNTSRTDPWPYYRRVFTFQGDGNSTGSFSTPGFCYSKQPLWSQHREPSFGHGVLDVLNETTALWSWYRNQDRQVVGGDSVYIIRDPGRYPNKAGHKAPL